MLRKLLKYDLKSALRIFVFIWLGIALMTGLVCLVASLDVEENTAVMITGAFSLFPTILAILCAIVFAYIYAAVRFYKGLLGQEGYLMFTLPTSPWKLLTSKLISSFVFCGVTTVLSLGAIVLIFRMLFGSFTGGLIWSPDIFRMDSGAIWQILLFVVNWLLRIIVSLLQIYLSFCLGHLFRGKRVLWAVLFYFAINFCMTIVNSVVQIVGLSSESEFFVQNLYLTLPLNLGLGILFFFLSEGILRKKLNLE
jgi:hypothetical protein